MDSEKIPFLLDTMIDQATENYNRADNEKNRVYWSGFVDGLRYLKRKMKEV